ncbi:MAG: hypothetical protein IPI92_12220 [Gemmatimonadetes bacterium]|nr:hypothetical protein [Gemmatimonadota bacterium]MBK7785772.1 hypothetical protein [Gemmatimonadota bacterium]MBK9067107.1 hypothetical protein [Gemmatimonadota bacterium]
MIGFLVFSLGVVVVVLLAGWHPGPGGSWLRNYLLFLLSFLLLTVAVFQVARARGLASPADLFSIGFVILGLATAVGAATRWSVYWEVASAWPLWSALPERARQVALVIGGLLIAGTGVWMTQDTRRAGQTCHLWYAAAQTAVDSAAVDARIPDPSLRPMRGRFDTQPRAPYPCRELVRARVQAN